MSFPFETKSWGGGVGGCVEQGIRQLHIYGIAVSPGQYVTSLFDHVT